MRERGSAGANARKGRQSADQPGGRETAPTRYRATVEYDGTEFAGFQVNPGKRTVQGVLEDALARLGDGVVRRVDGAGRTDAGVHATGQVIAFSYGGRLSATELGAAFEAILPRDVAVRDVRRTPDGFNPRYAARYREYRYTVWNGPPSPLRERTSLGMRDPLDTAAMERAGSAFIGRHDFRAFGAGTDPRSGQSPLSGSDDRVGT